MKLKHPIPNKNFLDLYLKLPGWDKESHTQEVVEVASKKTRVEFGKCLYSKAHSGYIISGTGRGLSSRLVFSLRIR